MHGSYETWYVVCSLRLGAYSQIWEVVTEDTLHARRPPIAAAAGATSSSDECALNDRNGKAGGMVISTSHETLHGSNLERVVYSKSYSICGYYAGTLIVPCPHLRSWMFLELNERSQHDRTNHEMTCM